MTDHAGTIRREREYIEDALADQGTYLDHAIIARNNGILSALDALLVERQQLEEQAKDSHESALKAWAEVAKFKRGFEEASEVCHESAAELKSLRDQRQQAIDALREATTELRAWMESDDAGDFEKPCHDDWKALDRCEAALVKLGEQQQ